MDIPKEEGLVMNPEKVRTQARTVPFKRMITASMMFLMAAVMLVWFEGPTHGQRLSGDLSATLTPGEIGLGETAMLRVSLAGEKGAPPIIPETKGLQFYPAGQSSAYESVNGRTSSTKSYLYMVRAQRPGDYTIPGIRMEVNGRMLMSPPLKLTVLNTVGARQSLPVPPAHRPARQYPQSDVKEAADGHVAFIRITPSKKRAFVGEEIPVEINAYFRQGVGARLTSQPTLQSPAFSSRELSEKPVQTERLINGRPYAVLTWHAAISPVKEGVYPVRVGLNAVLMVPQAVSGRRSLLGGGMFGKMFDHAFDDDFFDRFFSGTREQPVQLKSKNTQFTVFPLPVTGRPPEFTGAVGQFNLRATATPGKVAVGDPLVLKTVITGKGNFDRVMPPRLDTTEGFKTYTPSVIATSGNAGDDGRKAFEQAIIPMNDGITEIPPVSFSYFNPETQVYETVTSRPIPVQIASMPAQDGIARRNLATHPPDPSTKGSDTSTPEAKDTLAPVDVALGSVKGSMRPLVRNPWVLGAQGVPLGLMFVGLFLGRRNRKFQKDPTLLKMKATKHQINQAMREMDRAITTHDVPGFFKAGREATQHCLSAQWGLQPQSITLKDLKERLYGNTTGLCRLFESADAAAYSGKSFTQEELSQIRTTIQKELASLRGDGLST